MADKKEEIQEVALQNARDEIKRLKNELEERSKSIQKLTKDIENLSEELCKSELTNKELKKVLAYYVDKVGVLHKVVIVNNGGSYSYTNPDSGEIVTYKPKDVFYRQDGAECCVYHLPEEVVENLKHWNERVSIIQADIKAGKRPPTKIDMIEFEDLGLVHEVSNVNVNE